jgi:sugar phosphate isomerase/epimerase
MLPAPGGGPGYNPASILVEERQETVNQYREVIELCAQWGGKTVIYLAGWQIFGVSRAQAWEWSRNCLVEVARIAADNGVTMVVEPQAVDTNLIEGCDDAIQLMEDVGAPNVKLMFDTIHAMYRSEVLTDYVYQMGKNLHHLHLSDNDRLPPGQGRGDFVSLVAALKEIDYQGYLTMEIAFNRRDVEPDKMAREAFEYMKPLVS